MQTIRRYRQFILTFLMALVFNSASWAIPQSEIDALVNFANSTNIARWTHTNNWGGSDPCIYYGITCANGHVVSIFLYDNGVSGIAAIKNFSALQSIIITSNQLTGLDLMNLPLLQDIQVNNNQLTSFPNISGMNTLRSLNVHYNRLTSFPILTGMTSLYYLRLSSNYLTTFPILSGFPALQRLDVSDNIMRGAPPLPPVTLQPSGSRLCPNLLSFSPTDTSWNTATGATPWWMECNLIFGDGFES